MTTPLSPLRRAMALLKGGATVAATADATGLPRADIRSIAAGIGVPSEPPMIMNVRGITTDEGIAMDIDDIYAVKDTQMGFLKWNYSDKNAQETHGNLIKDRMGIYGTQRWIPVTERLPDIDQRVLAWEPDNEDWPCLILYRDAQGQWQEDDLRFLHKPTHWQLLPDGPVV